MKYSKEQNKQISLTGRHISDALRGKIIDSMNWDTDGEFWVVTFKSGEKVSFRCADDIAEREADK